ncbi:DEAD/DEAH box helicase [Streptococcus dysgalactiae]|uniref:DEAD/DEAH box helicase n=1 Tax=Streptococcus dysgalactiae TaxID=1334 RepID=UPI00232CBB4A|nr:DEAD/DEAH box helicase [Streptococcus dysgalactiae]WCE85963.1 DEAD/DEAH box helicase [Streptococcus dysgalactiae]WCN25959.1 DEAD/DEAH box helicase [Streptococcus dysgalactiae]
MKLRDYQEELVSSVKQSILNGNRSIIVQSPPRSGKTVVMAHIAKGATDKGNKVLFFSHRKEINDQVKETFNRNGVNTDLLTIGTVGSLVRKLENLPPPEIILVDEAHHIKAKQYQKILNYFDKAYHLFFTGTPIRLDGSGFKDMADDLVVGKSIKWLQDQGNISKYRYYSLELIDKEKLKKSHGDYTIKSIDESLDSWKMVNGDYVTHYEDLAKGKQAIVYASSVVKATEIATVFSERGYSSAVIHGSTPKGIRDKAMKDFRDGDLLIMVNVNLFTEGIDLPSVDVCIMLRPTTSLSLYLQFAMRALNPRDGKEAILIDHVGNWKIHGFPNQDRNWTLEGKKKKSKDKDDSPAARECPKCYGAFFSTDIVNGCCPYCGEKLKEEPKKVEMKKVNGELVRVDEIIEIELNGKNVEMSPKDYAVFSKVKKYGKNWRQCQTLPELQAFALIHNYKKGWIYYKQKEKEIWR